MEPEPLTQAKGIVLQWARLFYMYGPGHNSRSLLVQLDQAIERGDKIFNMSPRDQLRDYLPVEEVARRLAVLASRPEYDGIVNVCSGIPISVRDLVEAHNKNRKAKTELNLGHY